jgi:hypothetical protein
MSILDYASSDFPVVHRWYYSRDSNQSFDIIDCFLVVLVLALAIPMVLIHALRKDITACNDPDRSVVDVGWKALASRRCLSSSTVLSHGVERHG